MKKEIFIFILAGISAIHIYAQIDKKGIIDPKDLYLEQNTPGTQPEMFADGIIANSQNSFHTNIVFTQNSQEVYWHKYDKKNSFDAIVYSRLENGKWSQPQVASFSKNGTGDDAPFISPDGKRLYFISKRPIPNYSQSLKQNIWFAERTESGWSEPEPLPQIINSMKVIHWQLSVDSSYNLYFGCCNDIYAVIRKGDIYWSKFVEGKYSTPEKLSEQINSSQDYNSTPYISSDGSYLMLSRENYKSHRVQIFISFRKSNSEWTEAQNIIRFIGDNEQNCPIVTPDGKYLFFLRYVNSFCQPFWVDAKFIRELENSSLNTPYTE